MPFVNVYYHENILNKEELKKIGECSLYKCNYS